jgi:hypothetical protein
MREAFYTTAWLFGKAVFFSVRQAIADGGFPPIYLVSRAKARLKADRFFDKTLHD